MIYGNSLTGGGREELHQDDFLATVFESLVGYAIVAADFDGKVLAYNQGANLIYGYPPEDVIGRINIEAFFPEDFIKEGKLQEIFYLLLDKGRYVYEGEKVRKNGEAFPARVLFTLARNSDDKIIGFIEIVQDLTEYKEFENKLKAGEERFRRIIESNLDGIIILGDEGLIQYSNPAAQEIFGRTGEELRGSQFGFPMIGRETTEIEVLHKGGKTLTVEMRAAETEWYGHKAPMALLRDITVRKMAEEAMLKANDELRMLDRMKSELIATVSHELRTPLTHIKNAVDLMAGEKAGLLNETQARFLDMAVRNVKRLGGIINDLLDYSRIDRGRLEYDFKPVDLKDLAEKIVKSFQSAAAEKSLTLDMEYPEDLPPVLADDDRMIQILSNLVSNAIKFTDQGRVRVSLKTSLTSSQKSADDEPAAVVEVSVEDTGRGISSSDQEMVFTPFYQVKDTLTKTSKEGFGLGLAIIKRLVEAHGSMLSVESEVGRGSRFFFPLNVSPSAAMESAALKNEITRLMHSSSFSVLKLVFKEGVTGMRFMKQMADYVGTLIQRDSDIILPKPVSRSIVVLLDKASRENAMVVHERIVKAFSQSPPLFENAPVSPPAIIGPLSFPEDRQTVSALVDALNISDIGEVL